MIVALLLSMAAAVDEPVVAPPPLRPIVAPPPIIYVPAPALPPAPNVSIAAKPTGVHSLVSLFSTDDYPVAAIRAGEEGTTQVRLLITTDGRVGDCQVIWSSGSSALDQATCAIIQRRARFRPARDARGRATIDYVTQRVRWELPDEAAFSNWLEREIVSFDTKGKPAGCRFEMEQGNEEPVREDYSDCSAHLASAQERAQGLVLGHPDLGKRSLSIVFEQQFEANPVARPRSVGSRSGEQLISLQVAEFEINPGGSVVNCQLTLRRGAIAEADLCQEPPYDLYESLPATEPQAMRRGRTMRAVYLKR